MLMNRTQLKCNANDNDICERLHGYGTFPLLLNIIVNNPARMASSSLVGSTRILVSVEVCGVPELNKPKESGIGMWRTTKGVANSVEIKYIN